MIEKINTRRLLTLAREHGWWWTCANTLLQLAGLPAASSIAISDPPTPEDLAKLPATVSYAGLRHLGGVPLLDVADSVEGAPIRHGARLLLTLAHRFMVPALPREHAAYSAALKLLGVLTAYRSGQALAEEYMVAALEFRRQFCVDPSIDYADLFAALPWDSLDQVIADEGWDLARHWLCFGDFLVRQGPEFGVLNDLRERATETLFVDSEADADMALDRGAEEAVQAMITAEIEIYRDIALEELDEELRAVVDDFLGYLTAV